MQHLENATRNAVRAIIIRQGQLLVQKKTDGSFTLPGGAPNVEETLQQGLERECYEEVGATITITGLVHVADYFKPRKSKPPAIRHHIEFFFICSVADDYIAQNGPHPDKRQVAVQWLPLADLADYPFVPESLIETLIKTMKNLDSLADNVTIVDKKNNIKSTYLGCL